MDVDSRAAESWRQPDPDSASGYDRREWLSAMLGIGAAGALGASCGGSTSEATEAVRPKRIVTGRDASGKSVFRSTDVTPSVVTFDAIPGLAYYELYATSGVPVVTGHEPDPIPLVKGGYPAPGNTFFRMVLFPPAPPPGSAVDPQAFSSYLEELERKVPGMASHFEREAPGMHTSDTLDYVVVIKGELDLELDNGQMVRLRPGDCVVQNGTRHRWTNPLPEPCLIAAVMVGATRTL